MKIDNKLDGDGLVARKNRKKIKLSMYDISLQKYLSSNIGKSVLLNTKKSELWHIQPRQKPIRFRIY